MIQSDKDFDQLIERRGTDSIKWNLFDPDVIAMWVADMDFRSPQAIIDALQRRVEHGVFGYPQEPQQLRDVVVDWVSRRYNWKVSPDALVFLPNVAVGFNLAVQAVGRPGTGLLYQPPIYFPILDVPQHAGMEARPSELIRTEGGHYEIDFDDVERAASDNCSTFILCNPHNPVGRAFTRDELEKLGQICLRHNMFICSDEIHADFVYDGRDHIPIASIDPEIAARTITLIAPNKSFNVAGISCAIAVVPNPDLRARLEGARRGLVPHVGIMSYVITEAAYTQGEEWLDDVVAYLQENRDYLRQFVADQLPGVRMDLVDGTYLAWLDCRKLGLKETPHEFFLREARVGMNDGARFGPGGEGFVRLNFATPRSNLTEALQRMRRALLAREDNH
ncbi:MAG TPA: putative C-S lyase [Candidatus Acetothermia bacterium]|nr:putative C-S lyase [Candidatus Acetothermia bacterium]